MNNLKMLSIIVLFLAFFILFMYAKFLCITSLKYDENNFIKRHPAISGNIFGIISVFFIYAADEFKKIMNLIQTIILIFLASVAIGLRSGISDFRSRANVVKFFSIVLYLSLFVILIIKISDGFKFLQR